MSVNMNAEKVLPAILAPFGGAETHNEAGEAIKSSSQKSWSFTLHNTTKETHLTFRSRRPKGWTVESPVLIDLMSGSDNESFGFIGSINARGFYKASPKSKVSEDRLEVANRTLVWLMTKLTSGQDLPSALEIKGSTGCARCGRKLTNPDSIDDGLGPICRGKASKSQVSKG
jgi:hypothetical protein